MRWCYFSKIFYDILCDMWPMCDIISYYMTICDVILDSNSKSKINENEKKNKIK